MTEAPPIGGPVPVQKAPRHDRYDLIVVGAGIGGLGLAVMMATRGWRVLVLERHYRLGGYAHAFRRKQLTFDSCVRVVAGASGDFLLGQLLEECGLLGRIPFLPIGEAYRAVYPGHDISVPTSVEGFVEAYARQFPAEADGFARLAAEMSAIYDSTVRLLAATEPTAVLGDERIVRYQGVTFDAFVRGFISEPVAAHMVSALWGFYGIPPAEAGAVFFSYALMRYLREGVYYVRGSFQVFADAFAHRLAELGGEVCIRTDVARILVEGGAAQGVELADGARVRAPVVAFNGDLRDLFGKLVDPALAGNRYLKRTGALKPSISAFETFIATRMDVAAAGMRHEVMYYRDYDAAALYGAHLDLARTGPQGLRGSVLSCPTLIDGSLAPPGVHTVVATTLVPADVGVPWHDVKAAYEAELLRHACAVLPGLDRELVHLESGTPDTMERFTGNRGGASYGWDQGIEHMGRRPGTQTPVRGLFATGHWTGVGGGLVAVLLTSHKLARRLGERSPAEAGAVAGVGGGA